MAVKIIVALQIFFLIYTLLLQVVYLGLIILALFTIRRYMERTRLEDLIEIFSDFELPVSVLVPAYNEEQIIVSTVRSLLNLKYSSYEIIVINDGSSDTTIDKLIENFSLVEVPEAYARRLPTAKVRRVFISRQYPRLRVIDKENGGKADALNAGINASRFPLICSVDADSILQSDSLKRVVKPFAVEPNAIGNGGTIRIINGSQVEDGVLTRVGLPPGFLVKFEIIEYLRAFLFGRIGWSALNALMVLSGAFSVFKRQVVVDAGGYRTGTLGEDMELVVRLHSFMRRQRKPYTITFIPDPLCWTEAPSDLNSLKQQRVRWQKGLGESLALNRDLLFRRGTGILGWFAFPFMLIFELFGPLVEIAGYIFVITGLIIGFVSWQVAALFFLFAVGLGVLISVSALLLEEVSFHIYNRPAYLVRLFVAAVLENFGYRQIISLWRLKGLVEWLLGRDSRWGKPSRTAAWQKQSGIYDSTSQK